MSDFSKNDEFLKQLKATLKLEDPTRPSMKPQEPESKKEFNVLDGLAALMEATLILQTLTESCRQDRVEELCEKISKLLDGAVGSYKTGEVFFAMAISYLGTARSVVNIRDPGVLAAIIHRMASITIEASEGDNNNDKTE